MCTYMYTRVYSCISFKELIMFIFNFLYTCTCISSLSFSLFLPPSLSPSLSPLPLSLPLPPSLSLLQYIHVPPDRVPVVYPDLPMPPTHIQSIVIALYMYIKHSIKLTPAYRREEEEQWPLHQDTILISLTIM